MRSSIRCEMASFFTVMKKAAGKCISTGTEMLNDIIIPLTGM